MLASPPVRSMSASHAEGQAQAQAQAQSQSQSRSQAEPSTFRSVPTFFCHSQHDSSPLERIYELADIRRAASLGDYAIDVWVAHTTSHFSSRFCVEMHQKSTATNAAGQVAGTTTKWIFGVSQSQLRALDVEIKKFMKQQHRKKLLSSDSHGCVMCDLLRKQLQGPWKDQIKWFGWQRRLHKRNRNMDTKCQQIQQFFATRLGFLTIYAETLDKCECLRELLRICERVCSLRYSDEHEALHMIKAMKRPTANRHLQPAQQDSDVQVQEQDRECSICLNDMTMESAVVLPCGHVFHDTCICRWFHTRLNCPMCRACKI